LLLSVHVVSCNLHLGLLQQPTDTLRLYAVGDINLGRRLAKERLLEGDTLYPFLVLRDSLAAADITFGNLESPIAPDSSAAPDSVGVFTAPSRRRCGGSPAWASGSWARASGATWRSSRSSSNGAAGGSRSSRSPAPGTRRPTRSIAMPARSTSPGGIPAGSTRPSAR